MGNPTMSDVHVNRPLTNLSVAYLQDTNEFVAGKVFPNIPVEKASDTYFEYPKNQWFRSDAQRRAPSTESAGTGYGVTTGSYSIGDPLALHKDVADRLRENQDQPLDLDKEATLIVTHQLLLKRELEWATKYFGKSIWSGVSDASPTTKWDASSSTPIALLRETLQGIKSKTGRRGNTVVLAEDTWNALQDNADFLDRIAFTQTKIVTTDLLAGVLQVDKVVIAGAIQNTATEEATPAMASIFSGGCLVMHVAPNPGIMTPSAGYTFSLRSLFGAGNDGLRIKRFRMEPIASDRVEGEIAYDQKIVATDLGAFIYDCLT